MKGAFYGIFAPALGFGERLGSFGLMRDVVAAHEFWTGGSGGTIMASGWSGKALLVRRWQKEEA